MLKEYMILHLTALICGYILDLLIGDPHGIPHPVAWIGSMIGALEKRLCPEERDPARECARGTVLWIIAAAVTFLLTLSVLAAAYCTHPFAGAALEAVLTCYILAARSLRDESMKVYEDLAAGDLAEARHDLSMIVGRDTQNLDPAAVTRAAVETVAENASDGVIAPLLYTAIGGPVLGLLYKAVNTMDSMLGYRNDRYEYFGKTAAKMDDVWNFIPARISALLLIAAAAFPGEMLREMDAGNAYRIWRRDRMKHKSPNSAQTESACAGALGVRLGGPSVYKGVLVEKPCLGDETRPSCPEDIRLANRLMFAAEAVAIAGIAGIAGILMMGLIR